MENKKLSIVVPSREEKFLNNTVNDILTNATGPIEVFVVLDGYEIPESEVIKDDRVKYIRIPDTVPYYLLPNSGRQMNKRIGVNLAVEQSTGEFVMSVDAHCCFAKGFDEVLTRDCEDNMVMVPRRYKLDPIKWGINDKWPPVDYEYWMWPALKIGHYFKNYTDNPRRRMVWDSKMIDETLTLQASCWIMKKDFYKKMGYMQCEGYTPWGMEGEELALKCWTGGGRLMINKNTWYAHLFKGKVYGRMYLANDRQGKQTRIYAYDYWINKNMDKFEKVIERFMPLANWPADWKEQLKQEEGNVFQWSVSQWG